MTLRRKSREFALQMLFEWDMTRRKPTQVEQHFWKQARAADSTRKFANQLFEGAVSAADASDKSVEKLSENWKLERLAAVDRSILRLAIYELRFGTAPVKVVIDEALELAKKFSSAESPAFLNGILDAASKLIEETATCQEVENYLRVDVTFKNADGGAADFRSELALVREHFDVNFAGAAHFHALGDLQLLRGFQLAVMHQVSAQRAAGGARCRILNRPPRNHATRVGAAATAERETVRHGAMR